MGWNDHDPHAARIETLMLMLEEEFGMEYPESYDRALEIYIGEMA